MRSFARYHASIRAKTAAAPNAIQAKDESWSFAAKPSSAAVRVMLHP